MHGLRSWVDDLELEHRLGADLVGGRAGHGGDVEALVPLHGAGAAVLLAVPVPEPLVVVADGDEATWVLAVVECGGACSTASAWVSGTASARARFATATRVEQPDRQHQQHRHRRSNKGTSSPVHRRSAASRWDATSVSRRYIPPAAQRRPCPRGGPAVRATIGCHGRPARLVAAVVQWYARSARDLPWRAPACGRWAVLVSEVMLQQTPVERVLPAYRAWLARWPSPAALAADSPGEAVRMWGKLGYPRRALRLHECAVMIGTGSAAAFLTTCPSCSGCPGSAHTRRGRSRCSRSVSGTRSSTRTCAASSPAAVSGQAAAGAPSAARDHAAVAALLPAEPAAAARCECRADGARRAGVHVPLASVQPVPHCRTVRVAAGRVSWRSWIRYPPATVRGHRPPGSRAAHGRAPRER